VEVDLPPVGRGRLQWTRTYNSLVYRGFDVMSSRWTHTYTRRMWWKTLSAGDHIGGFVFRPDGTMRTSVVTGAVPVIDGRQRWSLSSARGERLYRLSSNIEWIYIDPAAQAVETFIQELRNVENYWGRLVKLQFSDGVEQTMQYSSGGLVGAGAAPALDDDGNPTDQPLPPGLLLAIRDSFGRSLSLGYDARRRLVRLVDPGGSVTRYTYDGRDNLTSVIRPDGSVRRYLNNEAANTGGHDLPHAVTGIIDEREQRLSTYQYDVWGRALSSTWWADGGQTKAVQRSSFSFDPTLRRTTVTDAIESTRTLSYQLVQGRAMVITTSQPAGSGCGPASSEMTYDANGNVVSRVDFNGNKTCYAYDTTRNLETKRVEGFPGTADCSAALSNPPAGGRVVSTQWHPDWHLKTKVAEPKRIITTTYHGYGASCAPPMTVDGKPVAVACSRTEQATTDASGALGFGALPSGNPRRWSYTYETYGRVLTATDPNGKRTAWTYYADDDADLGKRGNVKTITNAAGHVTRFTDYNLHALPTRVVDPNGLVSTFEYDSRMRLRVQTVGAEVTRFEHDPAHGQVTRAMLPDGSSLRFGYDTAYRLTSIVDHRENRVDYTLDAAGNRTQERMKDPSGALVRNIARVVDALNRVERVTGASR